LPTKPFRKKFYVKIQAASPINTEQTKVHPVMAKISTNELFHYFIFSCSTENAGLGYILQL